MPSPALDRAARAQGFKDYAQWAAWNARQQEMRGYNGTGGAVAAPVKPKPVAPPPERNWLQQLMWGLGGAK